MKLKISQKYDNRLRFSFFNTLLIHLSDIKITLGKESFTCKRDRLDLSPKQAMVETLQEMYKQCGFISFDDYIRTLIVQVDYGNVLHINNHIHDQFLPSLYDKLPKDEFMKLVLKGSGSYSGHLETAPTIIESHLMQALSIEMAGLNYLNTKQENEIAENIKYIEKIHGELIQHPLNQRIGKYQIEAFLPDFEARKELMSGIKNIFMRGKTMECEPESVLAMLSKTTDKTFETHPAIDKFNLLSYIKDDSADETLSVQYFDRTVSLKYLLHDGPVPSTFTGGKK